MAARKLLPYQQLWVADNSQLKVCEKGRRIGLSWAEAYDSVMHAAQGDGNVFYQSYSKEMTSGFIDDCAGWAEVLQAGAAAVGESVIDDPDGDIQCFRLDMSSGKQILAMTSAPRAFRSKGKPGDIGIIDEAAFVDDLGEVLKAALAFLVWGGRVRVISTHNGEASAFNRLLQDVTDGVRSGTRHRTTFSDAVNDGLYERICKVTGSVWSPEAQDAWEAELRRSYGSAAAEELDCIPAAGGGAWLKWNLIRQAERDDAGIPKLTGSGATYIAVDVARRRHCWVAVVFEVVGDVLWLREMVVRQDIPFSEQEEILRRLVDRYRPVRIAIDQTGIGEQFTERAKTRHGSLRVVGVLFSAGSKLDMAISLRQAFEDGRIRIVGNDDMRDDLHSVKSEPRSGDGPPRLAADEGKDGSHGDRFWACAMAAWLAAVNSGPFEGVSAADKSVENRRGSLDSWTQSAIAADRKLGIVRGASAGIAGTI